MLNDPEKVKDPVSFITAILSLKQKFFGPMKRSDGVRRLDHGNQPMEMKWRERRCEFLRIFFGWGEDFQAGLKECHERFFLTGPRVQGENLPWKSMDI